MKQTSLLGLLLAWAVVGCQSEQPVPLEDGNAATRPDEINVMDLPQEYDSSSGRPFTTQDRDRIERQLQIKLPGTYREFMLARSQELLDYTYPLRGETELWLDWEFFGFNVDRLISENAGQRRPEMAAGDAFPGWWETYFFFGSNGGGDYYALRLDGTPGVWFLACDAGTATRYANSLDEYVDKALESYPAELEQYRQLESLYQRKVRGEIEEADFEKQWQEIISHSASPVR